MSDREEEPDYHAHEKLDKYGYCLDCGIRVISSFKGFPLPDRPKEPHGKVRHLGSE